MCSGQKDNLISENENERKMQYVKENGFFIKGVYSPNQNMEASKVFHQSEMPARFQSAVQKDTQCSGHPQNYHLNFPGLQGFSVGGYRAVSLEGWNPEPNPTA